MNTQELAADIAKELRANPKAWTQYAFAKTATGRSTSCDNPDAVCWCLMGHVIKRNPGNHEWHFFDAVRRANGTDLSTDTWNDMPGRTADEVIEVLDRIATS